MDRHEKIELLKAIQEGRVTIRELLTVDPAPEFWEDHPNKPGFCMERRLGLLLSHDEMRQRFGANGQGNRQSEIAVVWCNVDLNGQ